MKYFEQMPPRANGGRDVCVEATSQPDDAPETVLDLKRPDLQAAVAAGEFVQPATTPRPQQAIQLFVVLGRTLIHEAHLLRSTINIGRDARQDLTIDDASVSRSHCQIIYHQGDYHLRDLGTSNGTTLNGRATVSEKLLPGDEIGIGRYVVIFSPTQRQLDKLECTVNAVVRPLKPAPTTKYLSCHEIDSVRQAVRAEREAHLLGVNGNTPLGRRFLLNNDAIVLGRGKGAHVPILGSWVEPCHAEIVRRGHRFLIRRRGRWRRVLVNGRSIREQQLTDGDTIQIARTTVRFFEPAR